MAEKEKKQSVQTIQTKTRVEKGKSSIASVIFGRTGIIILLILLQFGFLIAGYTYLQGKMYFIDSVVKAGAVILVIYLTNNRSNPAFKMVWMTIMLIKCGTVFHLHKELWLCPKERMWHRNAGTVGYSFKYPGDLFNLIRSDFVAAGYDDIIFSAQHIDQSVLAHISKIFGADIVITHDFLIELRFMIITLHIHGSAAGEKARCLFGRIDCIALLIKKDKFCMAGRFSDAVFLIRHCIEIQDTGASGLCCSA